MNIKKIKKIIACMMLGVSILAFSPESVYADDTVTMTISNEQSSLSNSDCEESKYQVNPLYTLWDLLQAKKNTPERLKDGDGNVDLGKFDQRVSGNVYREKRGWTIERDRAGERSHGGSYWKLKNKSGDRVATLDRNGKILRG